MPVRLSPHFDATRIRAIYREDKRVRIQPFLDADDAAALLHCLARETAFANAFNVDGANGVLTDTELERLSPDDARRLQQRIHENAGRGDGFLYGRRGIAGEGREPVAPLLTDLAGLLNSEAVLAALRDISGCGDICAASAQATRYLPGNFLTRHNDHHPDEGRRVAYVLSLTPEWHPDWGGLLQFYRQDGAPRDAWSPRFNAMSLFDVAHVHAVTYVAPFAMLPRYSVTGWFRATPLPP